MTFFNKQYRTIYELRNEVMELRDENSALRRILADVLRRSGCPEDMVNEAVSKAVEDAQ